MNKFKAATSFFRSSTLNSYLTGFCVVVNEDNLQFQFYVFNIFKIFIYIKLFKRQNSYMKYLFILKFVKKTTKKKKKKVKVITFLFTF